jgi:polyhydroxybutyrate depolymerase
MAFRSALFGAFVLALVAGCGSPTVDASVGSPKANGSSTVTTPVTPAVQELSTAPLVQTASINDGQPPDTETAAYSTTMHITVDGTDRSAMVHIPPHNGAPLPVVVALHGSSSSAGVLESVTNFDEVADQNGFAVVYPEGLLIDGEQSWNSGQCCEPATSAGVNDITFIGALTDALIVDFHVDAARVFVTGHSNGAILAQKIGCELADRVTAVASVSGALDNGPGCHPSRPLSMLEIHGMADQNVRYESGQASTEAWRWFDQCIDAFAYTVEAGTVTSTTTACASNTEVKLLTITDGSHDWPENGAQTVWDFFRSQPPLPTEAIASTYLRLLAARA